MAKKTCPNGHNYDPNIYGDDCPLCPAPGAQGQGNRNFGSGPSTQIGGAPAAAGNPHTQIAGNPGVGAQHQANNIPKVDPVGNTQQRPARNQAQAAAPAGGEGHTVIRRPATGAQASASAPGRKLVGFLVTYNRDPNGKAYNIYEGRNIVGRDSSCDIAVTEDNQMSGKHMSILYRSVDDKFKFRDEQSSNGTFVNKELKDDGELENYDIIRAGNTLFLFIAIPRLS